MSVVVVRRVMSRVFEKNGGWIMLIVVCFLLGVIVGLEMRDNVK